MTGRTNQLLGGFKMKFFEMVAEAQALRNKGLEVLAVEYFSRANPSNRHCVICRSESELASLKAFYREWDYQFNLINC
jgi:hypothetical protein